MSREDFNAWVERTAAKRDSTILLLEAAKGAEKRTALIEALREETTGIEHMTRPGTQPPIAFPVFIIV